TPYSRPWTTTVNPPSRKEKHHDHERNARIHDPRNPDRGRPERADDPHHARLRCAARPGFQGLGRPGAHRAVAWPEEQRYSDRHLGPSHRRQLSLLIGAGWRGGGRLLRVLSRGATKRAAGPDVHLGRNARRRQPGDDDVRSPWRRSDPDGRSVRGGELRGARWNPGERDGGGSLRRLREVGCPARSGVTT